MRLNGRNLSDYTTIDWNLFLFVHLNQPFANFEDPDYMMKLWRSGIDHLIDIFYNVNSEKNHGDLTEELALQLLELNYFVNLFVWSLTHEWQELIAMLRLLKKNTTLNEEAAQLLLQRAIVKRDGELMFSRDPILKDQVRHCLFLKNSWIFARIFDSKVRWKAKNLGRYSNDHYAEWYSGFEALKDCSTNPTLLLLSSPSFFADGFNDMTISSLKQTKNKLDVVYVNGTHHFHMIQPEEVSILILKFLNENLGKQGNIVVSSKLWEINSIIMLYIDYLENQIHIHWKLFMNFDLFHC